MHMGVVFALLVPAVGHHVSLCACDTSLRDMYLLALTTAAIVARLAVTYCLPHLHAACCTVVLQLK